MIYKSRYIAREAIYTCTHSYGNKNRTHLKEMEGNKEMVVKDAVCELGLEKRYVMC